MKILSVSGFVLLASVSLSLARQVPLPFAPGETLSYKIKWGIFSVGSAVLEVGQPEEVNGTMCHKLSLTVRTNGFADAFYKVRTRAESYVDANFTRSFLYKKRQQEGKTDRDVEVRFDYSRKLALYFNHGKLEREIPLKSSTFDPLAIAYLFRLGEVRPGQKKILPTCDGRLVQDVEVTVKPKEKLRVPAGKYEAFEASPSLKNLRGVFKKSPKGMLRVWYSSDARRIPVKMSSKVVVGSFTARLDKIENKNVAPE